MIEIRIHGRGGQGSVTAAELLAVAAFNDGYESQAFPHFGVERRGAPVQAYVRISKDKIRIREHINNPDILLIQDPTLIDAIDVFAGLKKGGIVIINSEKCISEMDIPGDFKVFCVPATKIALDIIKKPIFNTVMLGAFALATDLIKFSSIESAIKSHFSTNMATTNLKAIKAAYTCKINSDICSISKQDKLRLKNNV